MDFSPTTKRTFRVTLTVLACLLLLLASGLFFWLPSRSLAIALRPNLDILVVLALALAWPYAGFTSKIPRRLFIGVTTFLFGFAIVLGVAQSIAMREFGYHFTLAYHMGKVKALLVMMYQAQSSILFILSISALLLFIALIFFGCAKALRHVFAVAETQGKARRNFAIALALYAATAGMLLGFNTSITWEIGDQAVEVWYREERLAERAAAIDSEMKTRSRIGLAPNLKRPTLLVFVVESYGQILMEAEKYKGWKSTVEGYQTALSDHGYTMRSKVFRAPVFGGSSWLANASILCRFMISTEKTFISLFQTQTRCAPRPFNDGGYESVFAASNTTSINEEYSTRFPFDIFYPRDELGYKGPRISWSYMPDQYVIDVVERRVLRKKSDKPRFVYYKLTSSHHPWDTIPPYIADWDRIGDGSVYDEVEMLRYPGNEFLGGKFYNEGYLSSVEYSMETIVGYLNQMPKDREILAVILGDHQPRRPVADMDTDPWTIPLHVVSRDHELIERFTRVGYSKGLATQTPKVVPGLDKIIGHLFTVLNDVSHVESDTAPPR